MPDRYKKVQDYYLVVLNVMGSSPIGHPKSGSRNAEVTVAALLLYAIP